MKQLRGFLYLRVIAVAAVNETGHKRLTQVAQSAAASRVGASSLFASIGHQRVPLRIGVVASKI